ncbi:MAG: ribbon-helix-helix protein, CopG family [Clostridiales bacterium]|nr:ribbon-helix-helix protein, CopG family [Clostridiales bacterium]MDY4037567.1 ribbon-helix-helix protein, CopG family [Candidatus Pseudoscilispira sp.]
MIRNDSKKKVSISLPMELYEQITTLSEETERTTSAYIRQIVRIYLRYYAEHAQEAESDPLIVK